MIEEGAIDEVKRLNSLDVPPLNPAMKAIGVSQISDYLAGRHSLEQAMDLASAATPAIRQAPVDLVSKPTRSELGENSSTGR